MFSPTMFGITSSTSNCSCKKKKGLVQNKLFKICDNMIWDCLWLYDNIITIPHCCDKLGIVFDFGNPMEIGCIFVTFKIPCCSSFFFPKTFLSLKSFVKVTLCSFLKIHKIIRGVRGLDLMLDILQVLFSFFNTVMHISKNFQIPLFQFNFKFFEFLCKDKHGTSNYSLFPARMKLLQSSCMTHILKNFKLEENGQICFLRGLRKK